MTRGEWAAKDDGPLEPQQLPPYASLPHAATALPHRFLTLTIRNRTSMVARALFVPGRRAHPRAPNSLRTARTVAVKQRRDQLHSSHEQRQPLDGAQLDDDRASALPRERAHLTHETCRGSLKKRRGRDTETRISNALVGHSRAATHRSPTPALRYVSRPHHHKGSHQHAALTT